MKYRTGFVTNSSSSSYLIKHKENINMDTPLVEKYPFLRVIPQLIALSILYL